MDSTRMGFTRTILTRSELWPLQCPAIATDQRHLFIAIGKYKFPTELTQKLLSLPANQKAESELSALYHKPTWNSVFWSARNHFRLNLAEKHLWDVFYARDGNEDDGEDWQTRPDALYGSDDESDVECCQNEESDDDGDSGGDDEEGGVALMEERASTESGLSSPIVSTIGSPSRNSAHEDSLTSFSEKKASTTNLASKPVSNAHSFGDFLDCTRALDTCSLGDDTDGELSDYSDSKYDSDSSEEQKGKAKEEQEDVDRSRFPGLQSYAIEGDEEVVRSLCVDYRNVFAHSAI